MAKVLRMPPRKGAPTPRRGSKRTESKKLPAELLTATEIRAMLAKTGRGRTGIRNRAILFVLWRSGVRADELVALEPRDLDAKKGEVFIRHGKGDRQRRIGMAPDAFAATDAWLAVRREWGIPSSAPLFCTAQGRELNTSYLRRLLPRLGKRAGVAKRVHAHGLRHVFAVTLKRKGVDMDKIRRQLGHTYLNTTQRYFARIDAGEVVKTVAELDWTDLD